MNPRYVRKSFHGDRLIDLPTGDVLASTEDTMPPAIIRVLSTTSVWPWTGT